MLASRAFCAGLLVAVGIEGAAADPFFPAGSDALLQVRMMSASCVRVQSYSASVVRRKATAAKVKELDLLPLVAKVKQLDFAPQAEAATVEKMVASAKKGLACKLVHPRFAHPLVCCACVFQSWRRAWKKKACEKSCTKCCSRCSCCWHHAFVVSARTRQAVAHAAELAVKRYVYLGGCPRDYSAACPLGWSAGSVHTCRAILQGSCPFCVCLRTVRRAGFYLCATCWLLWPLRQHVLQRFGSKSARRCRFEVQVQRSLHALRVMHLVPITRVVAAV